MLISKPIYFLNFKKYFFYNIEQEPSEVKVSRSDLKTRVVLSSPLRFGFCKAETACFGFAKAARKAYQTNSKGGRRHEQKLYDTLV